MRCSNTVRQLRAKLAVANNLLNRVVESIGDGPAPDTTWWKDFFLFTGDHMICTEEGWQPGECKQEVIDDYGYDAIWDEVNAPGRKPHVSA